MYIAGLLECRRGKLKCSNSNTEGKKPKLNHPIIFILTMCYLTLPSVIPSSVFGLSSKWWWWSVIPAAQHNRKTKADIQQNMDKIPWVKQHRPRSNCQHAAMHKPLFFIRPLSCSPVPCGCIQRIGKTFESLLSSCDICLFPERRPRETSAVLEFSRADTGKIFRTMHENRWRKQIKIGTNAIIWSCLCLNCSKNLRSRSPSTEWDGRNAVNGLRRPLHQLQSP